MYVWPEDGRDDGDVRQVAAPCELRMVRYQHVALLDIRAPIPNLVSNDDKCMYVQYVCMYVCMMYVCMYCVNEKMISRWIV